MKKFTSLLLVVLLCVGAACPASAVGSDESAHASLSRFELHRYGEMAYGGYEIVADRGEYRVSVNDGDFRKLDAKIPEALCQVYQEYDLAQWDGFDESEPDVLDGEGFWLEIELDDGTSVHAQGDNAFPPRYFEAVGELQEILDGIGAAPASSLDGLRGLFAGLTSRKREWIVGADIDYSDITEFYYTYDSSTAMPYYQRYRFYVEDGKTFFYHETREGGGWPQTEEDITASGTVELTREQMERFHACLEGGKVCRRQEHLEDGDAGPWLYLYWSGDEGDIQEFAFASWGAQVEFEEFCEALRDSQG